MDEEASADIQSWGSAGQIIELAQLSIIDNPPREIHNSRIVGRVCNWKYPASSYKCRFDNAVFENVSFHNKDFKDCLFDDCVFQNCEITFASIVSSTFRSCLFKETPFKDEAIHDCYFYTCTFNSASFVGSMIRNSTIEECEFSSCTTSNKVFDACILKENSFYSTKLDFRAIRDNFGLSNSQIDNSLIRVDRSYPEDIKFEFSDVEKNISSLGLDKIDIWKLEYYKYSTLLFYGTTMDDAFNIKYWMKNIQTPNNFVRFLEGFSEFLIHEYKNNRCLYFHIVRLHALTFQLFQQLGSKVGLESVSQAVAGIHIRTGNIISEIDHAIFNGQLVQSNTLRIRTSEEYTENEIIEVMEFMKCESEDFNYRIIQRNSPLDVLFEIESINASVVIITCFILSKTKIEVEKVIIEESKKHSAKSKQVLSLSFGLADEKNSKEIFSMSSSVVGQYSISLCMKVGTNIIRKFRKILHNLISEDS